MVQIDDKLISLDIFEKHFICDLPKCLGACCIEGESGAPLEPDETELIEAAALVVKPMLSDKGRESLDANGAWVVDQDGDRVTPLVNGRECIYTSIDSSGVYKCTFEMAYRDGLTSFIKPISCQLYPIRVTRYNGFEALNYHQWHVCKAAIKNGEREGLPLFRFLKAAIERAYGEAFYIQMEEAYRLLQDGER